LRLPSGDRRSLIVLLLAKIDRFGLLVAELHLQASSRRRDAHVAVAETPDQVKGLSRRLLVRQPKRVLGDPALDRFTHLRRRAKESVRRHQSRQRLVRSLEIVRLHKQVETPLAIRKIAKHGSGQKLVPQRLPEALNLAECLWMLRPTLDMPHPLPSQLLLEFRLPAPRRVLPPLVRQDFPRHSI
jgi:hypothetical protein